MSPEDLSASWQKHKKFMSIYNWLQSIGLYLKIVPRDPNSLFRAVSEWVYDTQRHHALVRKESMFYMKITNNALKLPIDISVLDYCEKIMEESYHGGFNEITLLSHFYKRDIIVIDSKDGPLFDYCHGFGSPIYLYYVPEHKHFDTLLPIKYIETTSFCQSIVYEVLFKNVFSYKFDKFGDRFFSEEIKNVYQYNKKVMNTFKYNLATTKENKCFNECNKSVANSKAYTQKAYNTKKPGFPNKLFPSKTFKGLCPVLYKNIEYDVWVESKREKENSLNFHDGILLQVGVKCMLKIDPDQENLYTCYIQVMTDDGQCLVYVEELGEKKMVNSSQLVSLPANEAKPWYTRKKTNLKHQMSNKAANEIIASVDLKAKRLSLKNKKSNRILQDTENVTMNTSKTFFKTENLNSDMSQDNNNNVVSETEIMSSSYSTMEWENRKVKDGALNNIHCLEKFTRVDHITFKPPPYVEYVTMPLNTDVNGNFRDIGGSLNRQNSHYYPSNTTAVTCNSPSASYTQPANGDSNVLSSAIYTNASTPNSTPTVPPTGNGINYSGSYSPNYPSYPVYCPPPGGFPPIRPSSIVPWQYRFMNSPLGVNFSVQRSVNLNGSDLPYNDITTLRYFYNLGVEYSQNMGLLYPQYLHPPPPMTPMGNSTSAFCYQPTADQLALEMQSNLSVNDSPNAGSSVPNVKEHTSKPKFNEFRRGRGGHSKFRRNETNNERNGENGSNFNRGHFNNGQRKNTRNVNYLNNNSSDNNEKKEPENESALVEPSSIAPIISYPPPFYRHPSYPMESPPFGPPVYQNFMFTPEDGAASPDESGYLPSNGPLSHQFMTYVPPPPPPFFYTPPNVPNYYGTNFNSSPSTENQPPPKN